MDRREFFKLLGMVSVPVLLKPSLLLPAEKPLAISAPVAKKVIIPSPVKDISTECFTEILADAFGNMECDDLYVSKVLMSKTNFERGLKVTESFTSGVKNEEWIWGAKMESSDLNNNFFLLESTDKYFRYSYSMIVDFDKRTVKVINKSIFCDALDKRVASFKKIIERPVQHAWSALDVKDIQKECKKLDLQIGRFDTLDSHRLVVADEEIDSDPFGWVV